MVARTAPSTSIRCQLMPCHSQVSEAAKQTVET